MIEIKTKTFVSDEIILTPEEDYCSFVFKGFFDADEVKQSIEEGLFVQEQDGFILDFSYEPDNNKVISEYAYKIDYDLYVNTIFDSYPTDDYIAKTDVRYTGLAEQADPIRFYSDMDVEGDVKVKGNIHGDGDLEIDGDVRVKGGANVSGNANITGALEVGKNIQGNSLTVQTGPSKQAYTRTISSEYSNVNGENRDNYYLNLAALAQENNSVYNKGYYYYEFDCHLGENYNTVKQISTTPDNPYVDNKIQIVFNVYDEILDQYSVDIYDTVKGKLSSTYYSSSIEKKEGLVKITVYLIREVVDQLGYENSYIQLNLTGLATTDTSFTTKDLPDNTIFEVQSRYKTRLNTSTAQDKDIDIVLPPKSVNLPYFGLKKGQLLKSESFRMPIYGLHSQTTRKIISNILFNADIVEFTLKGVNVERSLVYTSGAGNAYTLDLSNPFSYSQIETASISSSDELMYTFLGEGKRMTVNYLPVFVEKYECSIFNDGILCCIPIMLPDRTNFDVLIFKKANENVIFECCRFDSNPTEVSYKEYSYSYISQANTTVSINFPIKNIVTQFSKEVNNKVCFLECDIKTYTLQK